MTDTVRVHEESVGRIEPGIYGHFAEHLGRCIYGGLWVGEDDAVETVDGVRTDTLELLQDLETPVLRWPGGCFADDYHWEDGVGPREERPDRRNLWWAQGRDKAPEESNDFGTDEFLALCESIDAEPYLAANVGSGDPGEATDWIEYCNYDGETTLAERRRENGREEPYGVAYWGIGNENWGCGGNYAPAEYARDYRRFATYMRAAGRTLCEEDLEFIACGDTSDEWNREFLRELGEEAHMVDHLSVHRYYEAGAATDFSDEQYYRLFADSLQLADDIERAAATVEAHAPGSDIGIIVDEWGVWHPDAESGLEQPNTVRDAVSAAGVLDIFNRHADAVTMANIAQTVNVLQCLVETDEERAWATPTYRVFDLYEPHIGATARRSTVETEERNPAEDLPAVPLVSASVSESEGGTFVTLSNRDLDARDVRVDLATDERVDVADAELLFAGADPAAASTATNADEFAPEAASVDAESGGVLAAEVPGSAVLGVRVE